LKYPFLKEHSDSANITGDFVDDDGNTVTKTNHWNRIFDFTKRDDGTLNFQFIDVSKFKVHQAKDLIK
jgi:ferritin